MRRSEARNDRANKRSSNKEEKNQLIEPNSCSRRSSTVHWVSDDDPTLCEVACEWRCGRTLKDPESTPFDRFSIRRPICAELLKNTCGNNQSRRPSTDPHGPHKTGSRRTLVSGRFAIPCFFEDMNEFVLPLDPDRACSLKCT